MKKTAVAKERSGKGTIPRSFRFSPEFVRLLDELAEREGLTNTGYLEMTIRRLARVAGIATEDRAHALLLPPQPQAVTDSTNLSFTPPLQPQAVLHSTKDEEEDNAYERQALDRQLAKIAALADEGAITESERELLELSESKSNGKTLTAAQVENIMALRRRVGLR